MINTYYNTIITTGERFKVFIVNSALCICFIHCNKKNCQNVLTMLIGSGDMFVAKKFDFYKFLLILI